MKQRLCVLVALLLAFIDRPVCGQSITPVRGVNGIVQALAVDASGNVYVGGHFSVAGNIGAENIAMWNPTTRAWSALDDGLSADPGIFGGLYQVNAIAVAPDGRVYIGGQFTGAGSVSSLNVVCWNPATHTWSSLGGGVYDSLVGSLVNALYLGSSGEVYVGGSFTRVGSDPTSATNIAIWDPGSSTWSAMGDAGMGVNAITVWDSNFYIAGEGSGAIAEWDGTDWTAVAGGGYNAIHGYLRALTVDSTGKLLVGGWFTDDDTSGPMTSLAEWNGSSFAILPGYSVGGDQFNALKLWDGYDIVAGQVGFPLTVGINSYTVHNIALYNPTNAGFRLLGTGDANGVTGGTGYGVLALATATNRYVYVGGDFTIAGGTECTENVAVWDLFLNKWSILGDNAAPSVSITSPTTGSIYTAPATVTIEADASDDCTVSNVAFYQGTTLLGTITTSPYNFTWTSVPVGTYTLTTVATDNNGASTTSAPVTITVVPPCASPSGLVAWWRAENNASDSLGGNDGFLENCAGYGTGEVSQAFNFDGTAAHVRVPDSQQLHFSTAMSYEAWIYPTSDNDSYDHPIVSKWNAVGGISQASFTSSIDSDGIPSFGVTSDGSSGTWVYGTGVVPINQWTHIAATYDGSTLSLYINGNLNSTQSYSGTLHDGNNDLGIGGLVGGEPYGDAAAVFAGKIDELALYNRALSATEIEAIYTAGAGGKCVPSCVTPPSGLVSCWRADSGPEDSVGGNNGRMKNGATIAPGFVRGAFNLNGTYQHIRVFDAANLHFSSTMSYEAWIYPTSDNDGNDRPIVSKWNALSGVGQASFTSSIDSDGIPSFGVSTNGFDGTWVYGSATIPMNQWTHIAATYDGSNLKLYLNGILDSTQSYSGTLYDGNNDLGIGGIVGGEPDGGIAAVFAGEIDELSLYNTALSATDIANIYNAGRGGKCISGPACITPPSGLVSLWRAEFDANDSIGGNNGTLENCADFEIGKVLEAFSFDGVSSHVRIPDASNLHFSSAMSYEAWIYPISDNDGSDRPIVSKWNAVGGINQASFTSSIDSDGIPSFGVTTNGSSGTWVYGTTTIPVNQWTHIAATYDGSNLRLYLNGSLNNTHAFSGTIYAGTNPLGIGALIGGESDGSGAAFFAGKIDEVSLYNRALTSTEIQAIYSAGIAGKCNP